jgi:sporulation protein YlmC with PRC-barrel domain
MDTYTKPGDRHVSGFSEGLNAQDVREQDLSVNAYDSTTYWKVQENGPGPRVMAASTLEGDTVVNMAGDKLGDIDEIMIDVPTGRVAYAVLSVGGFLGIGDKLLAIPWRALRLDPANKQFILDVSKERLKEAQGFDKDQWPSMADERWATELHNYYNAPYYWR